MTEQKTKDEAGAQSENSLLRPTLSHLILLTKPHLCHVLKFPKTPSWRQYFKE